MQPPDDPRYDDFSSAVAQYVALHGIPAATAAVAKDGQLLWSRGFGSMRLDGSGGFVPADALFRLASVTKPMTHALTLELVADGAFALADPVFCLGPVPLPDCHLALDPPTGKVPDPRLALVTVQHLVDHKAGWDRAISGDPMFKAIEIAAAMGVESPPDQETIARYMLGQPMDSVPGTAEAYSNFGFMLLGLVIEQATGKDYGEVLRDRLFSDPEADVELGRTLPADRNPREPEYTCGGMGPNVFDATQQVCWSAGGWHLEALEAAGGMVASAPAVADLLGRYYIGGQPRPPGETGYDYTFFGSLDGTFTMARQRPDGIDIVVLFDDRGANVDGYADIKQVMDTAAEKFVQAG